MKKFIPAILLFCFLTVGCSSAKRAKDALQQSISAPHYLIQQYTFSADRKKTFVEASVYYSQLRANTEPQFLSKLELNNAPMTQGLLKYKSTDDLSCGEKEKEKETGFTRLTNPRLSLEPEDQSVSEPTPKKSDFYTTVDGFSELNKITVHNSEGKTESYLIGLNPLRLQNPESVKLSRSNDNVIQLTGKGDDKKDHLNYHIFQTDGDFVEEEQLPFNPASKTISIPAKALKKFRKGLASFYLYSYYYEDIKTPGLGAGNSFNVSFQDKICVEIID